METLSQTQPVSGSPSVKHIVTQGLTKSILHKGNSWLTPSPGDEVHVHYDASLQDGNYFDSTREKGKLFTFKLGQCEVIRGLDEGVATMRKGERAIFTVPPDLAYGEVGCPPLIPPNSTLAFDIELVSWNVIRDITGDGGILKKIVKDGDGWATPKDLDEVLVKYVATFENGEVITQCEDGIRFSLAEGHLCPAMSIAVKTMRKGEKAELTVKLSYGNTKFGNGNISLDHGKTSITSNLRIQLELVSWETVVDVLGDNKVLKKITKAGEGFDRPNEGSLAKVVFVCRLEDGTIVETKGSNEDPYEYICSEAQVAEGLDRAVLTMRKGEEAVVRISSDLLLGYEVLEKVSAPSVSYDIKLVNFTKALQIIEFDHTFDTDERSQAEALRLSCNLNNAACKLKLQDYSEASRSCTKVLELDPFNIKALFRRSRAYLRLSELEKAEADIKQALAIDPANREVKLMYKELKDKQSHYVRREAELCSTMISRIG